MDNQQETLVATWPTIPTHYALLAYFIRSLLQPSPLIPYPSPLPFSICLLPLLDYPCPQPLLHLLHILPIIY